MCCGPRSSANSAWFSRMCIRREAGPLYEPVLGNVRTGWRCSKLPGTGCTRLLRYPFFLASQGAPALHGRCGRARDTAPSVQGEDWCMTRRSRFSRNLLFSVPREPAPQVSAGNCLGRGSIRGCCLCDGVVHRCRAGVVVASSEAFLAHSSPCPPMQRRRHRPPRGCQPLADS